MIGLQTGLFSFILAAAAVPPASTEPTKSKTIILGIDDFCPYTCLESNKPGFLVELIEVILSRSGYTLSVLHGSWTRLQILAQEGKVDLLGPITQYYVEKHKIPSTQELGGFFRAGFVTQADARWHFVDYSSLNNLKIAAIKDYSYPAELEGHLNRAKQEKRYVELIGDNANLRLVKMLASRRVDTVPMLFDVFHYQTLLLGLSPDKFKIAKELQLEPNRANYRIGVLTRNARERAALIQILDKGFATLKTDGTYQKIVMKYGIHAK